MSGDGRKVPQREVRDESRGQEAAEKRIVDEKVCKWSEEILLLLEAKIVALLLWTLHLDLSPRLPGQLR